MIRNIAFLVSLTLLFLSISSSARTFTDNTGKKFEATIINVAESTVSLIIPGKTKVYKVPFSRLSEMDQDYLKALKNKKVGKTTSKSTTKSQPKKAIEKSDHTKTTPKTTSITHRGISSKELKAKYRLVDNYLTEWPKVTAIPTNVNVKAVSVDKKKNRYVYHSPNYEFISDVHLSTTIVKQLAVMFEATREYCRKLPISTMKAHVPGNLSRNKILLFESIHSYVQNGGVYGSAGLFMSNTNTVLVPLMSVGVTKRSGSYNFDYQKPNKVLAHELAHQLTDPEYFEHGARGWFSEGLAEYCAVTPYQSGKYIARGNKDFIVDYVTAHGRDKKGGRNLGTRLRAPDLKNYMLQPYGSFLQYGNYNYGLGALITYYFFHMEPDRRNITSFLKALKKGKTGEDALKALLNGRTFDQLEYDISRAWKANGIDIMFN